MTTLSLADLTTLEFSKFILPYVQSVERIGYLLFSGQTSERKHDVSFDSLEKTRQRRRRGDQGFPASKNISGTAKHMRPYTKPKTMNPRGNTPYKEENLSLLLCQRTATRTRLDEESCPSSTRARSPQTRLS